MSLVLILGGIRSGKSDLALTMANCPEPCIVATGIAVDQDMAARIAAHKASRPPHWSVIEAPLWPADAVASCPDFGSVVVDSIDSWIGNLMESQGGSDQSWARSARLKVSRTAVGQLERLLACRRPEQNLIIVSAEAGLGMIGATPYARAFMDLLGQLNQMVASQADKVFLCLAGRALEL